MIIAAAGVTSRKYRLYVPDNVTDKVAKSWVSRREASIADYRVEKDVCPTLLRGHDAVHYLFPLADSDCAYFDVLAMAARSLTHLGWAVDMVAGNASLITDQEAARLSSERWLPNDEGVGTPLRVPVQGTLGNLIDKHTAFLSRIERDAQGNELYKPVPPLTAYRVVHYRRPTDARPPSFAAFSLSKPDGTGYRAFDPVRKTMVVAGMMRHTANDQSVIRALGWKPDAEAGFVHGHGELRGDNHMPVQGPRLAYVPLPSIEARGSGRASVVGAIRRALIMVVGGNANSQLQQIGRLLSAATLIDERTNKEIALLSRIDRSDKMVRRYTDRASTWSTVTPVILPGYDDPRKYRQRLFRRDNGHAPCDAVEQRDLLVKLDKRIEHLLRKAIRQAGYSEELARNADLDWRSAGFRAGAELATRYAFPKHLRRFRRLHVRIAWRDSGGMPVHVPGPICLGAGRFCGLGLFAAEDG